MFRARIESFIVIAATICGLPSCQPAPLGAAPSGSDPAQSSPPTPPSASPPAPSTITVGPQASSVATTPLDDRARTCRSLPAARPPDLVIGVSRHILPIGEDATVYRAELTESQSACRANLAPGSAPTYTCLQVTPAELDDLWRDFRKRSFTAMTSHPTPGSSPHYGGIFLWLRWGGQYACEVGDWSQARIDEAYDHDFSELVTAVETTGRKHL